MRALWNNLEALDTHLFRALDKIDRLRGKESFRARTEKEMENVRTPQRAISFDA